MNHIEKDNTYYNIVKTILSNEEFEKLKNIGHHGITRYDHSIRVSYYSYKIAKLLQLDYKKAARAGLLHDFFHNYENMKLSDRVKLAVTHPKAAAKNAKEHFGICAKEEDMIRAHMFPLNVSVPKYAESWVVNLVDTIVATFEFSQKFGSKLSYLSSIYIFFIFFTQFFS